MLESLFRLNWPLQRPSSGLNPWNTEPSNLWTLNLWTPELLNLWYLWTPELLNLWHLTSDLCPLTSDIWLLTSDPCPLTSYLRPLNSVLCPPTSEFCPLPFPHSAFRLPHSSLCPPTSVLWHPISEPRTSLTLNFWPVWFKNVKVDWASYHYMGRLKSLPHTYTAISDIIYWVISWLVKYL